MTTTESAATAGVRQRVTKETWRTCSPSWLDAGDAEFETLLAKFTVAARQHIEFEETRVWPGLRTALTAETADELGAKIADGKSRRSPARVPPGPGSGVR